MTLRRALATNGVSIVDSTPNATTLVRQLPADVKLDDVVLPRGVRQELRSVVAEWNGRASLESHGLINRNRIILTGPPGCGKTMTARALATEMHIPVFSLRLDAVVGSYLGQTALRISNVFKLAEETECVLLLDEIDALGRRRGTERDVAEVDRVVIGLMQNLDYARLRGIVVGASNLGDQLDPALARRFDLHVHIGGPSRSQLRSYVRHELLRREIRLPEAAVEAAVATGSFAECRATLDKAHRLLVLEKNNDGSTT